MAQFKFIAHCFTILIHIIYKFKIHPTLGHFNSLDAKHLFLSPCWQILFQTDFKMMECRSLCFTLAFHFFNWMLHWSTQEGWKQMVSEFKGLYNIFHVKHLNFIVNDSNNWWLAPMFNDYVLIRSLFNSRSFFFQWKKKRTAGQIGFAQQEW